MICKNCGYEFQGNFCNNCGQNSKVKRINLKYLLDEILNNIFQVDRGILYTIKQLSTRPGNSIRQYIEGKRSRHIKPLSFVLLTSTVYVLLTYLLGTNTVLGEVFSGISQGINNNKNTFSTTIYILNWMANNYAYSNLILLPLFSFASFIAFRKSGYNYGEHLVLNLYISGQQILIHIIFCVSYLIVEDVYFLELVPLGLGFLFTFWTFIQFFNTRNIFTKIFFTVLTYIYYIILLILIVIIWLFIEMLNK